MNWYEAFLMVDEAVRSAEDPQLAEAWELFLQSPFPHLGGFPPTGNGQGEAGVPQKAEQFLQTAVRFRGRGVELLLYRLAKAVEGLNQYIEEDIKHG